MGAAVGGLFILPALPPGSPRRAGSCLFFCISRRVPAYLCMSVPIYILYIYRAIRGTGEILGWLFPGVLVYVCNGGALIPSRPGGGKPHPENRIYFLMQGAAVYRCFAPPIKHAPVPSFPGPSRRPGRGVGLMGWAVPLYGCQIHKVLPGIRRRDPGPLHPSRPWGFILLLFYFRKCPVYTKVV